MKIVFCIVMLCQLCLMSVDAGTLPPSGSTAGRYYKMLQRKPALKHLFERFYNAWNENEYGKLDDFLKKQSDKPGDEGITALWMLARLYEKEGRDNNAAEVYSRILKSAPDQPEALLARSQLNFYAGEYNDVISDLDVVLKNKNLTPELKIKCLRLLGQAQIRSGNREHGLKTWQKLADISELENSDIEEDIIQLMLDEGMFDKALNLCIQLRRNLPEGYRKVALGVRLADIYHLKNERAKAVEIFAEILNSVGGDSWIKKELYSRIEREFKLEDDISGLLKFYQARIKKYSGDIMARKRYAALLRVQGDSRAAIEQLEALMKLTPLNYRNQEAYLDLLTENKQYSTALKLLGKLIKRAPNDYELLIRQAAIQFKGGDKQGCLKSVDSYLKHAGNNEYAWNRVAKMLHRWKYIEDEGRIYRMMTEKFPKSTDAQEAYAKYLFSVGKKTAALDKFRALAAIAPSDFLLRLARTLVGFKETQLACQILRQRYQDYKRDLKFMHELFGLNSTLEEHQECEAMIKPLLALAESSQEVGDSLALITMELKQAKRSEFYLEQLKQTTDLSMNQQCLLFELQYNTGSVEAAMQQMGEVLKNHPDSVVLNSRMLHFQQQQGNTVAAIKTLEHLLKLEPRRQIQYIREIIRLYLRNNQYKPSLKWVNRWQKIQPSAVIPLMTEADIYAQSGKLDQAIKILKKASFKFPENKEINLALAGYYLQNMNYDAAINISWKTMELEKTLAARLSLIQRIAELSRQSGNREQLVNRLRNRMKLNPKNIFPLLALAKVYKVYNDYSQYRYYLVKATENQSDNIELLYSLAALDEEEGNYDKAETTLKKIAEMDKSGKGTKKLAGFYFRGGDEDKGLDLILNNTGTTLTARNIKDSALVMFNAGRYEKTIDFLKEFVNKFHKNNELLYLYAVALEENGRFQEATEAFLNLIKQTRKMKGTRIAKQPQLYRQYYNHLPPVITDILKVQQSLHSAYRYRNNYRHYSSGTTGIVIPQSKDELTANIIVHLKTISGAVDSKEFNKVVTRLNMAGIRYADIKLAVASNRIHNINTSAWNKLVKKYSNDINIVMLDCLFMAAYRLPGNADKYEKLIAAAEKEHPEIALLAFFSAFPRNIKLKRETAEQVMQLLEKQEKLPSIYMLSGFRAFVESPLLDKKLKSQLCAIITRLYLKQAKTTKASQMSKYILSSLAKALVEVEDYPNFVKLLQHTLRDSHITPAITPHIYRHYQPQQLKLAPISFPPQTGGFYQLFLPGTNMLGSSLKATPERREKLWRVAEKINNPPLLLVIADYCGKLKRAVQLADELAVAKNSNSVSLAAGYYGKHKNYHLAATAAEKAADLNKNKQLKKLYYTAACYYTLKLAQSDKNKKLLSALSSKLLRLRLTDSEKASLAEAFQTAGMTEEAEKIDQMLLKKLTARKKSNVPRATGSGRRQTSVYNRVQKLLKAGKTDLALKLVQRPVKLAVIKEINYFRSSAVGYYSIDWNVQRLIKLLQSNNCAALYIKNYAPGDNSSVRKKLEYAIICEYFGKQNKAIKMYQELAAGKNGNRVAKMKLFKFYMIKDQAKAIDALTGLNFGKTKIIELILGRINSDQKLRNNPELQLKIIDSIAIFMAQLSPAEARSLNSSTFFNIFSLLEQQQYGSSLGNIPGVLTRNPEFKPPAMKKKATLYKQRQATYQRFVNACLNIPSLARQAFSRELTLRKIKKQQPDEKLFEQAIAILKETDGVGNIYLPIFGRPNLVPLVDAREFVINYALEHNKLDYLKQNIERADIIRLIEFTDQLNRCPAADFLNQLNKAPGIDRLQGKLMLAIYRKRKLKVDLNKVILRLTAESLGRNINYRNNTSHLAITYLESMNNSPDQQLAFIKSIAVMLVKRYKAIYPDGMPPGNRYSNQFNLKHLSLLSSLCQQFMAQNKAMAIKCAELIIDVTGNAEGFIQAGNLVYLFSDAIKRMPLAGVKDTPLVAAINDFSFMPINDSNRTRLLFVSFINNNRHGKKKDKMVEYIKQLTPQTFGTELILASVQNQPKVKIFAVCDKYLDDFKKLPSTRQQQFITELELFFNLIGVQPDNPQKNSPGYTFFNTYFSRISPDNKVEKFFKRKVDSNYHQYLNSANDLVAQLADQHPDLAIKIMQHALNRIRIFAMAGKVYTGNMRVEYLFISNFLSYRNKKLSQLGIVYRFMLDNKMLDTRTAERFQRRMENIAQLEWQNAKKQYTSTPGRDDSPSRPPSTSKRPLKPKNTLSQGREGSPSHPRQSTNTAMGNYLQRLEKSFPGKNAPLLFNAIDILKNRSIAELEKNYRYYATLPEPLSRVQREIKVNLGYYLERKRKSDATPDENYVNFYLEFINNPDIPLALKAVSGIKVVKKLKKVDKLVVALGKPLVKIHSRQQLPGSHNIIGELAARLVTCPVSDAWLQIAEKVAAIRLRDYMNKSNTKPYNPAIFEALALYCKTANNKEVERILALPKILTRQRTYIILVNYDNAELCRKLINKHWSSIQITGCNRVLLTNHGRTQADKIIAAMKPSDKQFFVKIIFAACTTRNYGYKQIRQRQRNYLRKLAEQFNNMKFDNPAVRQKSLFALAQQQSAKRTVYSELIKELNLMTPDELLSQNKFIAGEYGKSFKALLERGDYGQVVKRCKPFFPFNQDVKNKQYTNAAYFLESVINIYIKTRSREKDQLKLEDLKKMADFEYSLLKEMDLNRNMQKIFFRTMLLQSISGQGKISALWIEQIPLEKLNNIQPWTLKNTFSDRTTVRDLQNHFPGYKQAVEKFLESENLENIFANRSSGSSFIDMVEKIKKGLN